MNVTTMSNVFSFEDKPASIEKINVKKSSERDGGRASVELQVSAHNLPVQCLAALIFAPVCDVEQAFWMIEDVPNLDIDAGDQIDVRFLGLGSFDLVAKYEKRHTLKIKGLAEIRCDVIDKFKVTPIAGPIVECAFRVVISDPPAGWLDAAMRVFLEPCTASLHADPELDLGARVSPGEALRAKLATGAVVMTIAGAKSKR